MQFSTAPALLRPIKKPLKSITLEQNCTKQQIKDQKARKGQHIGAAERDG